MLPLQINIIELNQESVPHTDDVVSNQMNWSSTVDKMKLHWKLRLERHIHGALDKMNKECN